MRYLIVCCIFLPSLIFAETIDAVVATVDSQAITLSDLNQFVKEPKLKNLEELKKDKAAQQILDTMIAGKILEQECESRSITVNEEDLDRYFDELAKKNQVTLENLKVELSKSNIPYEVYRKEIRKEILKSRLVNDLVRRGPGVSDQQIEEYFTSHPALNSDDKRFVLSQIFISKTKRPVETARAMILELEQILKKADFQAYATKYSEADEAADGGLLGLFADSELSDFIRSAITNLKEGEISAAVESEDGFHIFRVDKLIQDEEQLKEVVRNILKEQNMSGEINDFMNVQIFNKHVVEKKYL